MIILDTNVLSELVRLAPAESVLRWVNAQPGSGLYTTTITQAEILYGIAILPSGQRRTALEQAATAMFQEDFRQRILPFDAAAAPLYAAVAARRRQAGRPIAQLDAQIAAIVASRDALLATRNTPDFDDCGIQLVDPWRT